VLWQPQPVKDGNLTPEKKVEGGSTEAAKRPGRKSRANDNRKKIKTMSTTEEHSTKRIRPTFLVQKKTRVTKPAKCKKTDKGSNLPADVLD